MSHDEMRFLRRDTINRCLHYGMKTLCMIREYARTHERLVYGHELQAYKGEWQS